MFYIVNRSLWLDIRLCWLTVVAIVSRTKALEGVHDILLGLGADDELLQIAARKGTIAPMPPPGGDKIVTSRRA